MIAEVEVMLVACRGHWIDQDCKFIIICIKPYSGFLWKRLIIDHWVRGNSACWQSFLAIDGTRLNSGNQVLDLSEYSNRSFQESERMNSMKWKLKRNLHHLNPGLNYLRSQIILVWDLFCSSPLRRRVRVGRPCQWSWCRRRPCWFSCWSSHFWRWSCAVLCYRPLPLELASCLLPVQSSWGSRRRRHDTSRWFPAGNREGSTLSGCSCWAVARGWVAWEGARRPGLRPRCGPPPAAQDVSQGTLLGRLLLAVQDTKHLFVVLKTNHLTNSKCAWPKETCHL